MRESDTRQRRLALLHQDQCEIYLGTPPLQIKYSAKRHAMC